MDRFDQMIEFFDDYLLSRPAVKADLLQGFCLIFMPWICTPWPVVLVNRYFKAHPGAKTIPVSVGYPKNS